MTQEQAVQFLEAIRASNIHLKGDDWVNCSCPLAPWTHQHGKDKTPSCGIRASEEDKAHYHCFACGDGSISEMLYRMEMYIDPSMRHLYDLKKAHQVLEEETVSIATLPAYTEFGNTGQKFVEWPHNWLDSFKGVSLFPQAMEYLKGRGVSDQTILKHKLKFDTYRDMIVCPYWDVYGRFAGARGRSIHAWTEGPEKHYDYKVKSQNNAKLVWYNEAVLDMDGPVVTVEGQFDTWNTESVWAKTLGNLTAKPSYEKIRKLAGVPLWIHIPDNDVAGAESAVYCGQAAKQHSIPYVKFEIAAGAKDPAECHPEYLGENILKIIADFGL